MKHKQEMEVTEIVEELVNYAKKYPMCNTIVFNTYDNSQTSKQMCVAATKLLEMKTGHKYGYLIEEPCDEHPEGTLHLAFISDKSKTLESVFKSLYK